MDQRDDACARRARLQQLFDAIENRRGDACFALERNGLFVVRADDRHGVGLDVETGAGLRDVVGDDQIHLLARPLLARLRAAGRPSRRRSRRGPVGRRASRSTTRRGRARMSGVRCSVSVSGRIRLGDLLALRLDAGV